MSWSYDVDDLVSSTSSGRLNVVRLLVGDTDTLDQQVQDEEITFSLSANNDNEYSAASYIAKTIAAKYSRAVTSELDGALRSEYSDLQGQYMNLALDLENEGKKRNGSMGVQGGGISRASVGQARNLVDRVPSAFSKDRFKNPPNQDSTEYNLDY